MQTHRCRRSRVSNLPRQRKLSCVSYFPDIPRRGFSAPQLAAMSFSIARACYQPQPVLLAYSDACHSALPPSRSYHRGQISAQHPFRLFHGRCWRYWISPRRQRCLFWRTYPSRDARLPARFRAFEGAWLSGARTSIKGSTIVSAGFRCPHKGHRLAMRQKRGNAPL